MAELPPSARDFVRAELDRVLQLPNYEYGVEGALPGREGRARALEVTLPRIAAIAAVD